MEQNSFGTFSPMMNYSKANLSEIVVSHVKHKILAGQLKSGDRLVEMDISDELEISRGPVREAIRELDMQGILSFSPRKGSHILELTVEDIKEIFSIRIPLEMQVLTLIFAKSRLEEEDLQILEMLNQEMISMDDNADESRKIYMLNLKDLQFHKYFWNKSGSFRRASILENQFYQLLIAMNQDITTLGQVQEKYEEHQKIIDACRAGVLADALAAFETHMETYLNAITRFELKERI